MHISVTGWSPQTLTLPNGDTIGMYDLVEGSYWSATGEFDLTGQVIGWGPDGIVITFQNSSVTCAPDRVRLAVEVAR